MRYLVSYHDVLYGIPNFYLQPFLICHYFIIFLHLYFLSTFLYALLMFSSMCLYMCVCIYVCVCLYVCMCVCVCMGRLVYDHLLSYFLISIIFIWLTDVFSFCEKTFIGWKWVERFPSNSEEGALEFVKAILGAMNSLHLISDCSHSEKSLIRCKELILTERWQS